MVIDEDRFEKFFRLGYFSLLAFLILFIAYQINDLATLPPQLMSFITPKIWLIENSLFALAGVILYKFLPKHVNVNSQSIKSLGFLDVTFFASLVLMAQVVLSSLYTMTLAYYILVSIACAMLGLKIILMEASGVQRALTLLEVSLFAIITRVSFVIANPYITGIDSYIHLRRAEDIMQAGCVRMPGPFLCYPTYHILLAIAGLFIASPLESARAINLLLNVVAVPVMFILGERMGGTKAGLMASLLLSILPAHLGGAAMLSPMASSMIFLFLSVMALMGFRDWRGPAMFWMPALALFFIHPFPSFVLIIFLFALFLSKYHERFMRLVNVRPVYSAFLSYSIAFISYLAFVATFLFRDVVRWMFMPEHYTSVFGASLHPTHVTQTLVFEAALAYLGPALLIMLAVPGGLDWLRRRELSQVVVLATAALLVVAPISNVLTKTFMHEVAGVMRAPPFVFSLAALPAGSTLALFISNLRMRKKVIIAVLSLLLISFFSASSYHASGDNMVFTRELPVSLSYITDSMVAAHSYLEKVPEGSTIFSDSTTLSFIMAGPRAMLDLPGREAKPLSVYEVKDGYHVLVWEHLKRGTGTAEGNVVLDRSFAEMFTNQNRLYDSSEVQVFDS